MPDDAGVGLDPETLEQQGFSTGFSPESDFFKSLSRRYPAQPVLTPEQQAELERQKREQAVRDFGATGGEAGAGLFRGIAGVGESLTGLGEVASKAVPFVGKYIQAPLKSLGDYLATHAAAAPAAVPSFADIQNPEDALKYSEAKVGEIVGFLAPTVILGLLSGGTTTELQAARALGADTTGQMTLGLSRELSNRLIQGGFIGSEIGTTFRGIRDTTGVEAPLAATVLGTTSGLLLNSGAMPIVKEFLDGGVKDELKRDFLRGYMTDVLSAGARHGLFLGGASAGSQAIHLLANKFADHTYPLVTSQNLVHVTDAFLSGLIGGGAVGAAGRAIGGPAGAPPTLDDLRGNLAAGDRLADTSPPLPRVEDLLASKDAADRAMAAQAGLAQPGPVYPIGTPPPDAGFKAAMADAAGNISKAADISVADAAKVMITSKPVTDAIIAQPDKPVPVPAPEPQRLAPAVDAGGGLGTAERPEGPTPVDAFVEMNRPKPPPPPLPPEPTKPTAPPTPPTEPKPEPVKRSATARTERQIAADTAKMGKSVAKALKSIASMGATEMQAAEPAFVEMLRGFAGKVPNPDIADAIDTLQKAMESRRQELAPSAGNLLVDTAGQTVQSHFLFDPKTGKVRLVYVSPTSRKAETAYTTNEKFKDMAAFNARREELLGDPTLWTRHSRATVHFAHDAPIGATNEKETWAAAFRDRLTQVDPKLGEIVGDLQKNAGLTVDQIQGIIKRAEKVQKGGKIRTVYTERLTPTEAAKLFPDAIKRGIELDLAHGEKPQEIPADATPEERAALEQQGVERETTLKRLDAAHKFEPEALREWILRSEERARSYREKPAGPAPAEDEETGEGEQERGGVVKDYEVMATELADKVDANLGPEASEIFYNAFFGDSVDRDQFLSRMTAIAEGKGGLKPAAAKEMAESLLEVVDQRRAAGGYRGRLNEGTDYKPQTDSADPIQHASARGGAAISALVNDPRLGFSEKLRTFTQRFMAQVDPIYLEHLTLQAVSQLDVNGKSSVQFSGTYEPLLRIAKVMMETNNPDVIAHEISHSLYYYLPEELRLAVDADWRKAVQAQMVRETDPVAKDLLQRALEEGGIRQPLGAIHKPLTDAQRKVVFQNAKTAFERNKARTKYGVRQEVPNQRAFVATWSNGSRRWDLSRPWRVVSEAPSPWDHEGQIAFRKKYPRGLPVYVRPGEAVHLDANQILIDSPNVSQAAMIADALPPVPLDVFSHENNPLFKLKPGATSEDVIAAIKEFADIKIESPDEVEFFDRLFDRVKSEAPLGRAVGALVSIIGPDGKTYKARFDGHQDASMMGWGKLAQFTLMEDVPGLAVKNSSVLDRSITQKGFRVELEPSGAVEANAPYVRLYHLTNPEEYFVRQLLRKTNGTVWDYVRDLVNQLGNVFKGWLGLEKGDLWDRIAKGFRDGEFENRYEVWSRQQAPDDPGVFGNLADRLKSFEANRKSKQTDELRRREAESAGTQNVTARAVMTRIADGLENAGGVVSRMARRFAGITQSNEILNVLDNEGTHPKTFQQILADPSISARDKDYFAADVARFQSRMESQAAKADRMVKHIGEIFKGPAWQRKLERLGAIKEKLEFYRENTTKRLADLISATIAHNQEELKSRSIAEGRSDQIMREIAALEKLKAEKHGIGQLMEHMVGVLSLTPYGRQLIMGEGEFKAEDVLHVYEAIAGPTAYAREIEKLNLPEGDNFYKDPRRIAIITRAVNAMVNGKRQYFADAANFLVRLHDLGRDLMATELMANDPEAYQDYVNNYGPKFLDMLQKDPAKFARNMTMRAVGAGTKEGMMLAAFRGLNRQIGRTLTHYEAWSTAKHILDSTLADPEIKAAHQAALNLIGSETPPVRLRGEVRGSDLVVDPHGNFTTSLPDGKQFKFNLSVGRERLPQETAALTRAITSIHDYLLSPEGLSDPYRRFWQIREKILSGIYNADVVLGFNPPAELTRGGWTILDRTLKLIGTASASKALVDAGNYNAMSDKIGTWMHKLGPKVIDLMTYAARSHPEIWGSGKSGAEAIVDWYDMVANQYFGKANAMGIVMRVGEETLPGTKINAVDEAALKGISSIIDEAYKIDPALNRSAVMTPQTLEERFGPRPSDVLFRKPLQTVPYMMPRQFRRGGVEFARRIHSLLNGDKFDDATGEQLKRIVTEIDANFHGLVRAYLEDRGKFAGGMFDPKTYKLALEKLVNGGAETVADLLEIFHTDKAALELSRPDTLKAVLGEIVKQVERVYDETWSGESDPRASFLWIQQHNSFTSARGEPIANYWFYDYGLRNNAAILNFAADATDFYFQRLYTSLTTLKNDLQREADTIRSKYVGAVKMGREDYARLRDVEGHKNALGRNLSEIGEAHGLTGRKAAMDWHLGRRALGSLVSAAIGNPVTGAINLLGSYTRAGLQHQALYGLRVLNPAWALQFGKEVVAGGLLLGRGVPKALAETAKAYGSTRRAGGRVPGAIGRGILAGMDELVNQTWLRDLTIGQWNVSQRYQEMAQYGWFPYVSSERMTNLWRLAETGGAVYTPRYSANPVVAKVQRFAHQGISFMGLALAELPTTVFPRMFDMVSNAGMMNLAEHVAQNIKLELARTYETLGDAAMKEQFNLKNPKDIANAEKILPQMVLGRMTNNNNLTLMQELFKAAGIGLNEEAVGFWKRMSETAPEERPKLEFLSSQQLAEFAKIHAEEINRATRTNRPTALYTNGVLRTMFPLLGWNFNAARQTVRWFGRARYPAKGESVQQLRLLQAVGVAGLLGSAAVGAMGQEEILRRLYRWVLGEERPGRQPWESDTDWDATKRVLLYASTIAPVLNIIPNMMFNDTPAAASQGIDLFIQNKVKDALAYIGGVINTGDPTYGLPDYAKRLFPITRFAINLLPGYSGIIELRNQTRLIQRYAPEDLRRPQSMAGSMGSTATELTPYGRQMVNAAMHGDMDQLQAIYKEAVQKAVELGRPNPEAVVRQIYAAQNPVRVALKGQPDANQWAAIEAKMGPEERAQFEASLQKYADGGNAIGASVGFYSGGAAGATSTAGSPGQPQTALTQPGTTAQGAGSFSVSQFSGSPAGAAAPTLRSGSRGGGIRRGALRSQLRRSYGVPTRKGAGRSPTSPLRGGGSSGGSGGGGRSVSSLRLRRLRVGRLRL